MLLDCGTWPGGSNSLEKSGGFYMPEQNRDGYGSFGPDTERCPVSKQPVDLLHRLDELLPDGTFLTLRKRPNISLMQGRIGCTYHLETNFKRAAHSGTSLRAVLEEACSYLEGQKTGGSLER